MHIFCLYAVGLSRHKIYFIFPPRRGDEKAIISLSVDLGGMSVMPEYDYIFVLLVYRNTKDLADFLDINQNCPGSCRYIVVNSYYDDASRGNFRQICASYGCDFVDSENKGYGCGNNLGIAYALEHYTFRYLIVCNPDIEIQAMTDDLLKRDASSPCIYGPDIRTLTGKRQNPCMVLHSPLREGLMRMFARSPGNSVPFYTAIAINKAERIVFNTLFSRRVKQVYSLHGSFLIFSCAALRLTGLPFDPEMFLFREEDYLARLARGLHIRMIYYPLIRVLHKEDGSVRFISGSVRKHTVDSLRQYFGMKRT